jgi:hypothetical protein
MNRIGRWWSVGEIAVLAVLLAAINGCGEPTIPPVGNSDGPGELIIVTPPDPPSLPPVSIDEPPTTETKDSVGESDAEPAAHQDPAVLTPSDAPRTSGNDESTEDPAVDPAMDPAADAPGADVGEPAEDANAPNDQETAGAAAVHSSGKPVVEEPLFEGWPKPAAAIMITGRQHGYLEPCGCAGLANQKGGMVRRYVLLNQLREKNWPVAAVDAGNQIRRFGRQAEIKFQITVEGLRMMDYQAIAFGPDDLRLPAPELIAVIAAEGDGPSEFVCANAVVLDQSFSSTFRVVQVGGKKIGVTSVLGARNAKMINNGDINLTSAAEGLDKVWPELESQQCDLYVLIAHATIDESIELAKKYPQFPIVITTGGAGEPALQPEEIEGTASKLVQVGTKGMFAGVIGLFDDPTAPLRYQRVPLDGRFPDSPEMLRLLAAYQDQLKELGWDGLEITTQPHPSGRKFVGSESCADCHPGDYDIWKDGLDGKGGPHWHATETLVHPGERSEVPRNFDPECISCHVIGWNPQKYYPYESGYLGLDETPDKLNVGCENCHGPASAHVAAELGDIEVSDDELVKLQEELRLPLERAEEKCMGCHDLDNSPAFQEEGAFERYWAKIKH